MSSVTDKIRKKLVLSQKRVGMEHIAIIRNGFTDKFGIPRQSGLIESDKAEIVFCPRYRNADALRGLEGFSHIWLLWEFSEAIRPENGWSPTVRPPRLGGNTRMGVFATRSPFRPNPIGLSCVRLDGIELSGPEGPVLHVAGADLMDGTPIYDIKPYIPFTDCRTDATDGFTAQTYGQSLDVVIPEGVVANLPEEFPEQALGTIRDILAQDPRPHYQDDPERVYGMRYQGVDVHFTVSGRTLTVTDIK